MRPYRSVLLCALLLLGAGLPARAAACGVVPGIGRACRQDGGWRVILRDGTSVQTHGADAPPQAGGAVAGFSDADAPDCVTDPDEFHGVLIYAHAADRPNRSATVAPQIRDMIATVNAKLRSEAALFGRTLDFRILCENGIPAVRTVSLSTRESATRFESVISDVRGDGYASARAHYWIYYDGRPPRVGGGTATVDDDARPIAQNRSNRGPGYAVDWGYTGAQGAFVMMHEAAHNLGAVNPAAPNSTGSYHCIDGLDVMCYRDGGPRAEQYSPDVCDVYRFDCNNDDYFHPAPPAGSYLTTVWNLASPLDRFVAGCFYATARLSAGGGAAAIEGVNARAYALPSTCRGRSFAVSAEGDLPEVASLSTVLPDADVCWLRGGGLLRCDRALGTDSGTAPPDADGVRIELLAGTDARVVLNVV